MLRIVILCVAFGFTFPANSVKKEHFEKIDHSWNWNAVLDTFELKSKLKCFLYCTLKSACQFVKTKEFGNGLIQCQLLGNYNGGGLSVDLLQDGWSLWSTLPPARYHRCSSGFWTPHLRPESCYSLLVFPSPGKTYSEAEAECQSYGTQVHLASLETDIEYLVVVEYVRQVVSIGSGMFWVGGREITDYFMDWEFLGERIPDNHVGYKDGEVIVPIGAQQCLRTWGTTGRFDVNDCTAKEQFALCEVY